MTQKFSSVLWVSTGKFRWLCLECIASRHHELCFWKQHDYVCFREHRLRSISKDRCRYILSDSQGVSWPALRTPSSPPSSLHPSNVSPEWFLTILTLFSWLIGWLQTHCPSQASNSGTIELSTHSFEPKTACAAFDCEHQYIHLSFWTWDRSAYKYYQFYLFCGLGMRFGLDGRCFCRFHCT